MLSLVWITITISLIYLIKLIVDYRRWMKTFYTYPSYTFNFSDYLTLFKGPGIITRKWTSRTFFRRALELTKDHDYFVIWVGFWPMIWLMKPKLIEETFKVHLEKTVFMRVVAPYIRDGLFMMAGDHKWKKFRKISEFNLRTKMLQKFFPIMSDHCDIMVSKLYNLGEDTWTDLNNEVGLTTFNVICESGAGVNTESTKLKHSALLMFELALETPDLLIKRIFNPLWWPQFTWTRYIEYFKGKGRVAAYEKFFKYFTKREISRQLTYKPVAEEKLLINKWSTEDEPVVKDAIDVKDDVNLLKSNQIENNFLSHLVDTYINQDTKLDEIPDNHDQLITPDDVINEINNFILAGFETVRTAILWTLTCLACEPTIQQRLYDELIEVFGDSDEKWTFDLDKLNQLTFLDCCVREGLRLFSPLQVLGRNTDSVKFQLDEVNYLPPQTEYLISIYSVHHDEKIYPQPEKFDPDRWSAERVGSIPFNCWIPFGSGPRICVGNRFAMYEMMIVIASIVKNFHLTTNYHYDQLDWNFILTLKPFEQVKFKVKPRKPTTTN